MYLPQSEHLAIDTLSGIFSDMSESYKIFWFNSILQGISKGNRIQLFDDIINRMVVDAWYMVTEYHLNLGPSDGLEKLVHTVQRETGLPSNAKEQEILNALESNTNKEISDLKKRLIRCVGRPEDRFAEDALRMLRAFRFAARRVIFEFLEKNSSVSSFRQTTNA